MKKDFTGAAADVFVAKVATPTQEAPAQEKRRRGRREAQRGG